MTDKKQEVVDRLQEELDAEGLDAVAARVSPEISMLVQLYSACPNEDTKYWIGNIVGSKIPSILLTATSLTELGPAISVDEVASNPVAESFGAAMDEMAEVSEITGSIRHAGEEIAKAIDRAVSATIITAKNGKHFNREAYLDLLQAHAAVIAALAGLDTVPECYEQAEDDESHTTH